MAIAVPTTASDISTASSSSANTLAVAKPVNITNGDLLYAPVEFRNAGGTLTADAGWVLYAPSDSNESAGVWLKAITNAAGEPATYNLGVTGAGSSRCVAAVGRITGADLTTPLDVLGSISGFTGTSSISIPGLTTGVANTMLFTVGFANTSGTTPSVFTAPGGTTTATQVGKDNGSSSSSLWIGFEPVVSAGTATGTRTPTLSPSAANSSGWQFSIRPAGATNIKTDSARPLFAPMFTNWWAAAPGGGGATGLPRVVQLPDTGTGADALTVSVSAAVMLADTATGVDSLANPNAPTTAKIEVEFTAGVWTDVSAYVNLSQRIEISRSRSSQFSDVGAASCNFELDNTDGRFTPRRQVLADGVTVNPYWPNIAPRKRVRVSAVNSGISYVRFIGRITEWPPTIQRGTDYVMPIHATDDLDRLSRVNMVSPYVAAVLADNPDHYWPMDEPAGSNTFASIVSTAVLSVLRSGTGEGSIVGMEDGPGAGNGNGWSGAVVDSSNGPYLYANLTDKTCTTAIIECWMKGSPSIVSLGGTYDFTGGAGEIYGNGVAGTDANATLGAFIDTADVVHAGPGSSRITANDWVHLVASFTDGQVAIYANGAIVAAQTTTPKGNGILVRDILLWRSRVTGLLAGGDIAQVSLYLDSASVANVLTHYQAGLGLVGETTGARVTRFLSYAGITDPTLLHIDTGVALCGPYGQKSANVLQGCQDMTQTEGAGSVFYVAADGRVRFTDRTQRAKNITPVMTFDAEGDLGDDSWAPTYDETTLANAVTAERATYAGTQTSRVITDAASIGGYLRSDDTVTSSATTDTDVLYNAQDRLSRRRNAGFRVPQFAVDLVTAQTSFYGQLPSLEIGSRVRVQNLPAGQMTGSRVDLYVEGWTESIGVDEYVITFDTSPAGNVGVRLAVSERGIADSSLAQCAGMTTTLTNAATTVVVTTSGSNPTFTTNAAQYPITIQVDEEQIVLNTGPGGSSSPQTFTGVTRGVNGTSAAAHTSAVVNLCPATTAAL